MNTPPVAIINAGLVKISFPATPNFVASSKAVSLLVSRNSILKYAGFMSSNNITMLPASMSPSINSPAVVAPNI